MFWAINRGEMTMVGWKFFFFFFYVPVIGPKPLKPLKWPVLSGLRFDRLALMRALGHKKEIRHPRTTNLCS